MIVLIYRRNDNQDFADACRIEAQERYPAAVIRELNPRFFNASSMDKADVVYVRQSHTTVRNAYVNSGTTVITSPSQQTEDVFTDKYEAEVMRLLSLSVKRLEGQLKGIDDKELIKKAYTAEKEGRARTGALKAYSAVLEAE